MCECVIKNRNSGTTGDDGGVQLRAAPNLHLVHVVVLRSLHALAQRTSGLDDAGSVCHVLQV